MIAEVLLSLALRVAPTGSFSGAVAPDMPVIVEMPIYVDPRPIAKSPEQMAREAARKYGLDEELWVRIGFCETGGTWDPNAQNPSGASGIYQQMPQYWEGRSALYGHPGGDIFDAFTNIDVSAQMAAAAGDYLDWDCYWLVR